LQALQHVHLRLQRVQLGHDPVLLNRSQLFHKCSQFLVAHLANSLR
jgi:hypothetical protein